MSLEPGTRLGAYEILGSIGAGGMGVVYRATDTALDREVAIKVLPESMAADEERLIRFDREAKTLASLNHTNIAQIYGIERSEETTALVMELVEGPTLEDRIKQGALPADESLSIAMQIAEAVEAAHGRNIVHRDLKPANIKLRPDGVVKVLDFGIAKALEPETVTSEPASPMMTTPATQVGVILGTAAYMSPEQAKGKPVDQRADIWAFGCVLYEMLTGQPAFAGEDVPSTLARVLEREPDADSLPASLPPAVERAVSLCLQKDLGKRIADIRDVKLALAGAFETARPGAAESEATTSRPLTLAAALVAGFGLASLIAWALWPAAPAPEPEPVVRFEHALPLDRNFRFSSRSLLDVSRDGRHFIYNALDGVYVRAMGELESRVIAGTEEFVAEAALSPDGQSIVFRGGSDGDFRRIAINGGVSVLIGEYAGDTFGIRWAKDGRLYFGGAEGILSVPATGGTPEVVVPVGNERALYHSPSLLPDAELLLYSGAPSLGDSNSSWTAVQSLTTGEHTVVIEAGGSARYLPTGHLVYLFDRNLYGIAFDLETLTTSGGAVPLVQGISEQVAPSNFQGANFSVSDEGTLLYLTGGDAGAVAPNALVWVDRDGREEPINTEPRQYYYPRISPDGATVAIDIRDRALDIWTLDLAGERLQRLTFDSANERFASWSSDGERIAFSSTRDSGLNNALSIYWTAADGSGAAERIVEGDGQLFPVSFVPDGSAILISGGLRGNLTDDDIAILNLDGQGLVTPLLQTEFDESNPEVSPNGRWLTYQSNESGEMEIYVRPFPDVGTGLRLVSTDGGVQPLWSRDGRELFYRTAEGVMAVAVDTEGESFRFENPELLFETDNFLGPFGGRSYDVSPDGQRFLMVKQTEVYGEAPRIVVVRNWFEEVERLVPTE
ncbi:MAG TPA: protein kinase [Gammaproteobacteria bacterium]